MTEATGETTAGGARVGWISATAALLLATQIASKATRDSLFLVAYAPHRLPVMMIAGAAMSMLAVVLMSRALARWDPRAALQRALVLSACLYVLEWVLLAAHPGATSVVLYLHVSALSSVLVSGFWTMVAERGDPHSTKRLVARVTAAAALGATVGGLGAMALADRGGARTMLPVLAATSIAVALAMRFVGTTAIANPGVPIRPALAAAASSVREIWGAPHLRRLAALSAIVAMWQAMLDFAFKAAADGAMSDEAALVAFFGLFYTGTSLLTFIVQAILGRLAVRHGHLAATLVVSPAWVVLSFSALAGTPFALLAALHGGETVLSNSFLRSGYEALFGPIPDSVRRATKTIVDVAATRAGDALGSVILLMFVHEGLAVPLVVAGGLGILGVWLVRPLTRGYVAALTEAVRTGVETGQPPAPEIALERSGSFPPLALEAAQALSRLGVLGDRARALTRTPAADRTRALAAPIEPELARLALALVGHDDTRSHAEAAIRAIVPRTVGSLVDALLDPATPVAVRRRVPRLLAEGALPRAIEGLLLGLDDPWLEVRMQCARALARTEGAQFARDRVLEAALREITDHGGSWSDGATEAEGDADDPLPLDAVVRAHASRSLQYVLVLLSLVTEESSLKYALEALSSTEPGVRGTALELLDNVVPDPVRRPLLAALDRAPSEAPDLSAPARAPMRRAG